jgi:hypothetical protein
LRTVVLVMKKYASDITFENQTMPILFQRWLIESVEPT